MQNRILPLPSYLANQIAAGEVIERPASVLKECLENSLDAKSQDIEIRIERGGTGLIEIKDDGEGIDKDDLALALTAHATSKITKAQDLEALMSLGFRGEALASISAVARIRLASKPAHQEQAWQLEASGRGTSALLLPSSLNQGTHIQIRDLFYNTPARRKFLKSEKTEFTHLEEVFKRIALSHFEVGFRFFSNQKCLYQLAPATAPDAQSLRIAKLFHQTFINQAQKLEADLNGLRLHGWIGGVDYYRPQTDLQYFYVNGRMVKDRLINHAIRQAYQDFCPEGRAAAYILFLECDPRVIDVNVHPTKHEIRFRDARASHAFIHHSLNTALTQLKNQQLELDVSRAQHPEPESFGSKSPESASPESATPESATLESEGVPLAHESLTQAPRPALARTPSRASLAIAHEPDAVHCIARIEAAKSEPDEAARHAPASHEAQSAGFGFGQFELQLSEQILLNKVEGAWALLHLDRLKDFLLEQHMAAGASRTSKPLLVPRVISVGIRAPRFIHKLLTLLEELGFIADEYSPEKIRIRSQPSFLRDLNLNDFFSELLALDDKAFKMSGLLAVLHKHWQLEPDGCSLKAQNLLSYLSQHYEKLPSRCYRILTRELLSKLFA